MKKQEWEHLSNRFARVIDGIGTHIDSGIMDVVIGLNALGVHTTASCEGHLDHGWAAPWVDIGSSDAEELGQKIAQLLYEGKREETEQLQQQHRLLYVQEELKIVALLDAFYQQHQLVYDRHLAIWRTASGIPRIHSHGSDYQEFRSLDERAAKLVEYQQEMQAFAAFLKERFFHEVE